MYFNLNLNFSGREQIVEREDRARQRDRNREALLINVLRQHAQNRAERIQIAANNNGIMSRDEHRQIARNNGESPGTSRNSVVPTKRKCLNYGPDSVETWANTEVHQRDNVKVLLTKIKLILIFPNPCLCICRLSKKLLLFYGTLKAIQRLVGQMRSSLPFSVVVLKVIIAGTISVMFLF